MSFETMMMVTDMLGGFDAVSQWYVVKMGNMHVSDMLIMFYRFISVK